MKAINLLVRSRIICALLALAAPAFFLAIANGDSILGPAFLMALIVPGGLIGTAVAVAIYPFAMAFYDVGSLDGDAVPALFIAISFLGGLGFWWLIGYVTLLLVRRRMS